jgi:hypothetical protein
MLASSFSCELYAEVERYDQTVEKPASKIATLITNANGLVDSARRAKAYGYK